MYNKHHSQKTKDILHEKNIGEKSCRFGKTHTKESIDKIIKANLGKKFSNEHREKLSKAKLGKYTGNNNYMYGKKHSSTAIKKMSETHKGIANKPVLQYSIDKKIIRRWRSIKEAAENLKICKPNISQVCNKKGLSAGKFYWEFEKIHS